MDAIAKLYELENVEVRELEDIDNLTGVPLWIEEDITCDQVAAILQGGCASGAYMPAVTYHQASTTMAEHGDDVLEYLQERGFLHVDTRFGAILMPGDSWSGISCKVLSAAVEAWADGVASAIEESD